MSDWILDHLFDEAPVDEKLKMVMGSGDVKEEFKEPCWEAYKRAIKDLKFLVKHHDGNKIFKVLKKEVMGE